MNENTSKAINIASLGITIGFVVYLGQKLQSYFYFGDNFEGLIVTIITILAIGWSASPLLIISQAVSNYFTISAKLLWLVLQLSCAWLTINFVYDDLNFRSLELLDYALIFFSPTLQFFAIRIVGSFAKMMN